MPGTVVDERPKARAVEPHLALHLVLTGSDPCFGGRSYDLLGLDELTVGRGSPPAVVPGPGRSARVDLSDPTLSTNHVRLRPLPNARASIEDLGSRNGTRVGGERIKTAELGDGDWFVAGRSTFLLRLVRDVVPLEVQELPGAPLLRTLSPTLAGELRALAQVAPSRVPVLLLGETGTGKEVVAQAVHALSGRRGKLVAVNCAALPETLIESELFGYRKGAFSGAKDDRMGLVRAADGGTLFLDEIGDMPPASQAKILRVLQEGEVLSLGATVATPVDVRVVAATQRDLPNLVGAGGFRADLLARLQGHTVSLPPLRARREDLGLMVSALLQRHAGAAASLYRLTADACEELLRRSFPLNVRELERTIQRAIELARADKEIDLDHLAPAIEPTRTAEDEKRSLRDELVRLLKTHRGNVSHVARDMGKARTQVQRWLASFGIDAESFRKS